MQWRWKGETRRRCLVCAVVVCVCDVCVCVPRDAAAVVVMVVVVFLLGGGGDDTVMLMAVKGGCILTFANIYNACLYSPISSITQKHMFIIRLP